MFESIQYEITLAIDMQQKKTCAEADAMHPATNREGRGRECPAGHGRLSMSVTMNPSLIRYSILLTLRFQFAYKTYLIIFF